MGHCLLHPVVWVISSHVVEAADVLLMVILGLKGLAGERGKGDRQIECPTTKVKGGVPLFRAFLRCKGVRL